MDMMLKYEEGLMWVKLTKSATSESTVQSLVPIRWTARRCRPDLKNETPSTDCGEPEEWTCSPLAGDDTAPCLPGSPSSSRAAPLSPTSSTAGEIKDDDDSLCIVCIAREANFQLLPCRHDRFCRQCIVETICTRVRREPPSCPLCRSPFHTMVLLD
jgi:hypothetical protein